MANCVVLVAVRLDDGMRGVAEKAVDAAASMSSSRAEIIVLLVMVQQRFFKSKFVWFQMKLWNGGCHRSIN
jgi:hypothetical protein